MLCWGKWTARNGTSDSTIDYAVRAAGALWGGDRGGVAAAGGLHRVDGTKSNGGHAGAAGADARGSARIAAADCGRGEIAIEGRHYSGQGGPADVLVRAAGERDDGAAGVFGAGDWSGISDRGSEYRIAFYSGGEFVGDLRDCAGRVGFEQPLFAAGGVAQRGATGELRNRGGAGADFGAAAGGLAFDEGYCAGAVGSGRVVRILGANRIFYLSGGLDRGNQSCAVRFAGSGIGTGGRVHDGVQRISLVALFSGGIREYGDCCGDRDDFISGRLAAARGALSRTHSGNGHRVVGRVTGAADFGRGVVF